MTFFLLLLLLALFGRPFQSVDCVTILSNPNSYPVPVVQFCEREMRETTSPNPTPPNPTPPIPNPTPDPTPPTPAPTPPPPDNPDEDGPSKPGWGYGDNNHKHTGPPGREGK